LQNDVLIIGQFTSLTFTQMPLAYLTAYFYLNYNRKSVGFVFKN